MILYWTKVFIEALKMAEFSVQIEYRTLYYPVRVKFSKKSTHAKQSSKLFA